MSVVQPLITPTFQQSVSALLKQVDCRPILSDAARDEVYRLRYAAYKREGALPQHAPARFCDRFDEEPNARSFGVYIDGRLCSSMRIHVVDRDTPEHPGLHVYADHLLDPIDNGETLIDPTRFVIDADASRLFPKLPYVTVRIAWMASEWFSADRLLATVRLEHQAFYRRLFGHELVCPPRHYPTLTKPLSLMSLPFMQARDRVLSRYGFFASSASERQALFASWSKRSLNHDYAKAALVA